MFRVFLKKKIDSDTSNGLGSKFDSYKPPSIENRRVFKRYEMNFKHLTVMNEADIFAIRDVSAKGFSTFVSPRAFERLSINDTYDARIRYLGEMYDLQARVAWKQENLVGFEIVMARTETFLFIQRLLKPVAIGATLAYVESSFTSDSEQGKSWFRGQDETDFFVWRDHETKEISAWRLATGIDCVEWSAIRGIATGTLKTESDKTLHKINAHQTKLVIDSTVDITKKQFAIDVIMALDHEIHDELILTFDK